MQGRKVDEFIARFELSTLEIGRSIGHCAASAGGEMTGPQHHVMRMIVRSGAMRSSDLAEALGIQPSAVTAAVDRLEARGYVARERDTVDRRVVHVIPTEFGLSEFRRIESCVRDHVRMMLDTLDESELTALISAFEKMSRAAQAARASL